MSEFIIELPKDVMNILKRIEMIGHEAVVIGGCVRNQIINQIHGTNYKIKDYDIATNAPYFVLAKIFEGFNPKEIGEKFGVLQITVNGMHYEIAKYRIDGEYLDSRKPEDVEFTMSLFEDTKRRDFTMNAIAYSLTKGIMDFHDGINDIRNKKIKFIGNMEDRINEDALRIMRMIRFISNYGFDIDYTTIPFVGLLEISEERISQELNKILLGEHVGIALKEMFRLNILQTIIPKFASVYNFDQKNPHHTLTLDEHIISVVKNTPVDIDLRLAALFHDLAKPDCMIIDERGVAHYFGHDLESSKLFIREMTRLKYPTQTIKNVSRLIYYHMRIHSGMKRAGIKKILGDIGFYMFYKLIDLFKADLGGKVISDNDYNKIKNIEVLLEAIIKNKEVISIKDLKIKGEDLIELGFTGETIGKILKNLLELCIGNNKFNTKENLIKEALRWKKLETTAQ